MLVKIENQYSNSIIQVPVLTVKEGFRKSSLLNKHHLQNSSFMDNYISVLPCLRPIQIKEKNDKDLYRSVSHLKQTKYLSPIKNYSKIINTKREVLRDIENDEYRETSKTVADLINSVKQKKNFKELTVDNTENCEEINKNKAKNGIMTINPMINYQKIIEDTSILAIYHNDCIKKMHEKTKMNYNDIFNLHIKN
jgi:hypothetical protein